MQPWSFLVIRDPNVRGNVKSLFESANAEASRLFEDERRASYMRMKLEGITDAPVNLCITCDRNRAGKLVLGRTHVPETDIYSTVCAVQNIWLAARSEGIGVGWVSIYRETELKELLGIPADQMVIAYLCIGHVAELFATPELAANGWRQRLELAKLIHFDTWRGSGGSLSLEPAIETERQEFVRTGCFEP